MRLTGPAAALSYAAHHSNDHHDIDNDLMGLLFDGLIEWEPNGDLFSMTELGKLHAHMGTIH